MRPQRAGAFVVALTLAAVPLLAGCGTNGASGTTQVTSSGSGSAPTSPTPSASPTSTNPYGAATVDPPGPNEPVLTVTAPGGAVRTFTMAQLEALGTTTLTVNEPFVKAPRTFTGVPMAAVFRAAGVPGSANVLTHALNDYNYTATAEAFTGSQGMIATRQGDGPVPYDQGGPIRIVFPDGSALSSVLDAWNWSLSSMKAT